ncbi:MAG: TetR/AcrR family transcriptional regulator [Hyphomicrobiales bacterium]|nr:TetR/AcrR family transcriptional regulator [Hyphomicrobiales bacterium]
MTTQPLPLLIPTPRPPINALAVFAGGPACGAAALICGAARDPTLETGIGQEELAVRSSSKSRTASTRERNKVEQSDDVSSASRRDEILAASTIVFSEKGYRACTIQDIAKKMGFTSAALYYYFNSKQDILSEIITRPIMKLIVMAEDVEAGQGSSTEKLHELIRRHITMMLKERDLFNILLRERLELSPEGATRLTELEEMYYIKVRAIIRAGTRAGVLRPVNPKVAALAMIGMVNWVLRWYRDSRDYSPTEVAEMMFDIFYNGTVEPQSLVAHSGAERSEPPERAEAGGKSTD